MRARFSTRGFSLIEILIAAALVTLAAMAGVAYITRGSQHADWSRDKVFARQKALSILAELRAYVEGGEGEVAADLDGFDDGLGTNASLTIQPDPTDPGAFLPPQHPVSDNIQDSGVWRWQRRITVKRFPGVNTRDLRICTVRMYRQRLGDTNPGEQMAEVSSVIRTIGDAFPTTQVYDVYLLALESVPGWWVYMDAIQPFIEATLTDLESRNPGLEFRTHWITKSGFGRDEEYAPYTNENRDSRANTPWAYIYPGRMPAGSAADRYYVPGRMQGRINQDGEFAPTFQNVMAASEPYTDSNSNGRRDPGESYTDVNGNSQYDLGNPVPYALADMHNHAMRQPDEVARHNARVAAGLDDDATPTWRMLLDRMIAEPDRYHNAILINLHGELLPMPPARNFSDAAKSPIAHPGWRAVAHPELLRPRRTQGSDAASDAPRLRVYAYKTDGSTDDPIMTQQEPWVDTNGNGAMDGFEGATHVDYDGDGVLDTESVPISIVLEGGDFTRAPNAAANPSLVVRRLAGGINADGVGGNDAYQSWANAARYPELFNDLNGDGRHQRAEAWFDQNGDGVRQATEPFADLDGGGLFDTVTEPLTDGNGSGTWDSNAPAEPFTDANGNGRWDPAEPYADFDGNGVRNGPTTAVTPWRPWNPAVDDVSALTRASYVASYGEPFTDVDGDSTYDVAETFVDYNVNGVRDGGVTRGEMWYDIRYDAAENETIVFLHGTPLETPYVSGRGINTTWRLYDLEYIPCPTPSSSGDANRFSRDLFTSGDFPKNTARWTVELPLGEIRTAMPIGAQPGDAEDRTLAFETRIGGDTTTGTMWPTRNLPCNLSRTFAYFHDTVETVPWSERYQFQGDARHSPYADTDRQGTTAAHGYNWYWDNFNTNGNQQSRWLAFDASRMRNRWRGRGARDVARYMQWLRTALVRTEAVYTTLTGFSYYYMSVGNDIGYDSANGFPSSIPVDGTPWGVGSDRFENTITGNGQRFVRSNNGGASGIRSGGYWWSKPWIGELFEDSAYASQWVPWGNLRAATGSGAGTYRQVARDSITTSQLPAGTNMHRSIAITSQEGCVSVFNIGTRSPHSTFHHQFAGGQTGSLVDDGPQLAQNYNFPVPTSTLISRPWSLNTSWNGGFGDEFDFTDTYPRFSAQLVRRFYDHNNGANGSGLVRLQEPGASPRGCFIVVNGIDRTTESGSAFIARYSMLSLIHSFFAAGEPGSPNRIPQLPRVEIRSPTLITELQDPGSIEVSWSTEWRRWDGLKYTDAFPDGHTESEANLRYYLMYSTDGGNTWRNMLNNADAEPGNVPWIDGTGPDPAATLGDTTAGGDETWIWNTPSVTFPEGSYLIRIEAYRSTEKLHYSQHMEKIYVER